MKVSKSKAIDNAIKKYEALLDDEDGFDLYDVADLMHNHYDNNVDISEAFDLAEKAIKKRAKVYYSVIDDYHSCATFYFLGTEKSIIAKIEKEGKKQVNKMLERTKKEEK